MERDKEGNIIWPEPSKGLVGKAHQSCRQHYLEAGLIHRTKFEKEYWGRVLIPLADVDAADEESHIRSRFYDQRAPVPNSRVEEEGWCVECKYPIRMCICHDDEAPAWWGDGPPS